MNTRKLRISNASIDSVLSKDYKDAILEYIWNGFDAEQI